MVTSPPDVRMNSLRWTCQSPRHVQPMCCPGVTIPPVRTIGSMCPYPKWPIRASPRVPRGAAEEHGPALDRVDAVCTSRGSAVLGPVVAHRDIHARRGRWRPAPGPAADRGTTHGSDAACGAASRASRARCRCRPGRGRASRESAAPRRRTMARRTGPFACPLRVRRGDARTRTGTPSLRVSSAPRSRDQAGVPEKKFTEPVALSSTRPTDLPLPRRAFRLSFGLLALRARCKEEPRRWDAEGQARGLSDSRILQPSSLARPARRQERRQPGGQRLPSSRLRFHQVVGWRLRETCVTSSHFEKGGAHSATRLLVFQASVSCRSQACSSGGLTSARVLIAPLPSLAPAQIRALGVPAAHQLATQVRRPRGVSSLARLPLASSTRARNGEGAQAACPPRSSIAGGLPLHEAYGLLGLTSSRLRPGRKLATTRSL